MDDIPAICHFNVLVESHFARYMFHLASDRDSFLKSAHMGKIHQADFPGGYPMGRDSVKQFYFPPIEVLP